MLNDFIESFRELDPLLIESVLAGYSVIFESNDSYRFGILREIVNQLSGPMKSALDYAMYTAKRNVGRFDSFGDPATPEFRTFANKKDGKLIGYTSMGSGETTATPIEIDDDIMSHINVNHITLEDSRPDRGGSYNKGKIEIHTTPSASDYIHRILSGEEFDESRWASISRKALSHMQSMLLHELVHAWDSTRFDLKRGKKVSIDSKKDYHRTPTEVNAHLMQKLNQYLGDTHSFDSFIRMPDVYDLLSNYTPSQRKRVLKRIHSIWDAHSSEEESISSSQVDERKRKGIERPLSHI